MNTDDIKKEMENNYKFVKKGAEVPFPEYERTLSMYKTIPVNHKKLRFHVRHGNSNPSNYSYHEKQKNTITRLHAKLEARKNAKE